MPYIPQEQRKPGSSEDRWPIPVLDTSGKLNYSITMLCEEYRRIHGDRYCTWNTIIGALECAKLEYARRVVAPYEDRKCDENGDVYASSDKKDQTLGEAKAGRTSGSVAAPDEDEPQEEASDSGA